MKSLTTATTLTTLKKVAFTLLCCTLLIVSGASAQTGHPTKTGPVNDPSNDGPPAGAILDLAGTPIPGQGNDTYQQYSVSFNATLSSTAITFAFREDPAFIFFTDASVVDVTADNGANLLVNGNFEGGISGENNQMPNGWTYANMYGASFGGVVSDECPAAPSDGSNYCWFDGAVQAFDAISQTITTTPGHTYQISFWVADSSGCSTETNINTGAAIPCDFYDTSNNGDTTDTGGNGIDVAVYAQNGLPPANETLTVTAGGLGTGTVTDNSTPLMINCNVSGGAVSGMCSASYPIGTPVVLTATATSPSTYGSWDSACSGTDSNPCDVTMTTSQSVSAGFVAPPSVTPVTIPTGTNVTTQAVICANGSNSNGAQCDDPNYNSVTFLFPAVQSPIDANIYITEYDPSGLCPASQVQYNGEGFPGGPTTDFDCRFLSFFNYGTDASGDVVTPLCWPYANGDCVTYKLLHQDGTPVLASGEFTGPLYWTIAWSNSSFTPPGPYWSGAMAPRGLDDPDSDEFTPPLPYGVDCSSAMQIGTPSATYTNSAGQDIYCQFVADVTVSYNPDCCGETVKSKNGNEVVVAFLPTSTGMGPAQTLPTNTAPTITGSCPNGCTVSGSTVTFTAGTGATFDSNPTGFPAPAVSESGLLPNGLTFNMTSGLITGTPMAGTGGTYPISITATNTAGSVTVPFTLVVGQAPAITSGNSTTFIVGTMGSFSAMATGFPAPTFSYTGSLPSAVSLSTAGLLSGTPSVGTGGTYPITIIASNGVGSNATQNFTLTVDEAPAITSANSATFSVGTTSSFQAMATGFPASTFSYTGSLPSGVSLSSAGLVSGTPGGGTGGIYPITIYANNGIAPSAMQSFTLTVDQGIAITSGNSTTFTVGTMGSFSVTATGFPAPTFSKSGALPNGVTLSAAGVLSGTPAAGMGGTYPITITASNGVESNATQAFTLTVDQAPAITSANNATFSVGTLGSFSVTASGFPASMTFSETGALPSGVTLSPGGVLSGTPAVGSNESYPITITASNGVSPNATQSFTLYVATLQVSPTTLNFGTLYLGGIGVQFFTVTNQGSAPITISVVNVISTPGTAPADYGDLTICSLLSSLLKGVPATLPAGKSCVIGVGISATQQVFSPTASTATLYMTDNAMGKQPTVFLTAQVIHPVAMLSSSKLTFPTTTVGETSQMSVTVTNTGKTPLTLGTATVSSNSGDFTVVANTCNGATIEPSGVPGLLSCAITVAFTPKANGTFTGTLTIPGNAQNGTQTVSLSGTT